MPTVEEKLDGTYFVRKDCDGPKTWQIDRKGLLFLKSQGVRFDPCARLRRARFSTELFFELLGRRLIYTGRG